MECKSNNSGIKSAYIMSLSDVKFDDKGNMIGLKRKYGKFKRPVTKLEFESLADAELWLHEKLNPEPNKEPIYHAYGK